MPEYSAIRRLCKPALEWRFGICGFGVVDDARNVETRHINQGIGPKIVNVHT